MSSESTGKQLCDEHHEPATVMCLVHQDFHCLQCLIDRKKTECDVKRIDKLSPSEKLLFEVLTVKKCLTERKYLVQNHSKTVHEKKDTLKAQIQNHAAEMVKDVNENEGKLLRDLEIKAKTLLDIDDDQEKKIQDLEADISKLFSEDAENIKQNEVNNMQRKLQQIKVMGANTISGSYKKKLTLSGGSENGLGNVNIFDHELYEEMQENAEGKRDATGGTRSQQMAFCHDVDITTEQSNAGSGISKEESIKEESTGEKGSSKSNETSNKVQAFCPFPGLPGLPNNQLHVHESPKKPEKSKASITNILVTDQNALVLFDENKHQILVSDFSGEIKLTHALSKDPIKITTFKENSFAILNCKDLKIKTFCIENKELKISEVKMSVSVPKHYHVLGFEYGKGKDCQHFALSGIVKNEGMVMLINAETGEVSNVGQPFQMSSSEQKSKREFKTLYDFKKNAVYILNTSSKTMKCYSFEKERFEWKIKCKDDSFAPDQVVFDDEQLYITSNENVTLFSKTSGETKTTHTAKIGKLKAICLMKNHRLAIVSSNSTEPQKSMTLEFIAL